MSVTLSSKEDEYKSPNKNRWKERQTYKTITYANTVAGHNKHVNLKTSRKHSEAREPS
jgi:hypothetical protein